jgi:hypothetical protein
MSKMKYLKNSLTIKSKMLDSLESGKQMTAWDWFYDFNVMYYDFTERPRKILCKNYFWYFN